MDAMDDYDDDDYMISGQMFHFRSDGKPDSRDVEIREQDRYLPIANIARIMKRVLPGNAKIAKDAKESIQECVSEFISFITSEASDKCQQEKRKTINGDDILWAMSTLGFEKYIDPLKAYLAKYRESVKGERIAEKKTPVRRDVPMSSTIQSSTMKMGGHASHPSHATHSSHAAHSSHLTHSSHVPHSSMSAYHHPHSHLSSSSGIPIVKQEIHTSSYSSGGHQYKWQTSTASAVMPQAVPLNPLPAPHVPSTTSNHATRAQTAMGSTVPSSHR